MAKQNDRDPPFMLFDDIGELDRVRHHRIPAALAKVPIRVGRAGGATVATMIIRIDMKARVVQKCRYMCLSKRMLSPAVGNLYCGTGIPGRRPTVIKDL